MDALDHTWRNLERGGSGSANRSSLDVDPGVLGSPVRSSSSMERKRACATTPLGSIGVQQGHSSSSSSIGSFICPENSSITLPRTMSESDMEKKSTCSSRPCSAANIGLVNAPQERRPGSSSLAVAGAHIGRQNALRHCMVPCETPITMLGNNRARTSDPTNCDAAYEARGMCRAVCSAVYKEAAMATMSPESSRERLPSVGEGRRMSESKMEPLRVAQPPSANETAAADDAQKNSISSRSGSSKGIGVASLRKRQMNLNLNVSTSKTVGTPRKASFIQLLEGETIEDFYELGEQLHDGGRKGKVHLATSKHSGDNCVVKFRLKHSSAENERVWRTIMLNLMNSEWSMNLLDIQKVYEDQKKFYIVMARCSGGELFDFLLKEAEVSETECKRIIREILVGLNELHKRGIVHRDVKPENILFTGDKDDPCSPKRTVKLIDFDTCQQWCPETPKAGRFAGTPGYIAPETLLGELSPQSDLWAVGVILHILMTGDMPWTLPGLEDTRVGSQCAEKMHHCLKEATVNWDCAPWPDFPQAADLCKQLLAFETAKRIPSADQALRHPWIRLG